MGCDVGYGALHRLPDISSDPYQREDGDDGPRDIDVPVIEPLPIDIISERTAFPFDDAILPPVGVPPLLDIFGPPSSLPPTHPHADSSLSPISPAPPALSPALSPAPSPVPAKSDADLSPALNTLPSDAHVSPISFPSSPPSSDLSLSSTHKFLEDIIALCLARREAILILTSSDVAVVLVVESAFPLMLASRASNSFFFL